jgi:putative nucleotidyltransferase with HDIG domain
MGIAALAYYVIETGLIATVISLSTGTRLVVTWRTRYHWLMNHYLVLCGVGFFAGVAYTELGLLGLLVFVLPLFTVRYAQKQYVDQTTASVRELQRMNTELTQANREVSSASSAIQELNRQLQQLNDELFQTLGMVLDARDPYVGGHAAQVAYYAAAIAQELGLPAQRVELVRQAGFLHDLGKIGIAEQILHKPGKLTAAEYEIMKMHAGLGAQILELSGGLRHLAPFVRSHHERWDGKGALGYVTLAAICDSLVADPPAGARLVVADRSLDVVYCTGVFMHLDEWERFRYVVEARRVLRPGGRLYVDNFNLLEPEGWALFMEHFRMDPSKRPANVSRHSTPQELERYLAQAGYENVRVRTGGLWVTVVGLVATPPA